VVTPPLYHRALAAPCPLQRGPGSITGPLCPGAVPTCCTSDARCGGSNGRCNNIGTSFASCSYDQCFSDSNCPAGTPCLCRGSPSDPGANVCLPKGNCTVDSDCGIAGYCSPSPSPASCGPGAYYCHTRLDTCTNDSDCPHGPSNLVSSCLYDSPTQHWACQQHVECSSG
jgi:hypothetical protein